MGGFSFVPWAVPPLVTAAVAAAVAVRALRRRPLPGAFALGVSLALAAAWNALHALEIASATLPAKLLCLRGEHVAAFPITLAWLAFALDYSGRRRALSGWPFRLALLVPAAGWALTLTDRWHGLLLTRAALPAGGPGALVLERGSAFWAVWTVQYGFLAAAVVVLTRALRGAQRVRRRQVAALVVGGVLPWAANVVYVTGVFQRVNPTPLAFAFSSLVVAWSLRSGGLLDLVPVARGRLIEEMRDGVLVLDGADRVIDVNQAARRAFSWSSEISPVGREASEVLGRWPDLLARILALRDGAAELELERRRYEVRVTALEDPGRAPGRLFVFRDVTEHKENEAQRARLAHRQKVLYDVLHELERPLEPAQAASAAANVIAQLSGWSHVGVALPSGDDLLLHRARTAETTTFAAGRGVIGRVFRSGRTELVDDVREDPDYVPLHPDTRAELAVPIVRGERVLGVLKLESEDAGAFGPENVVFAESLADAVGLALENAQFFRELARDRDRREALIAASRDGIALVGRKGAIRVVNGAMLRLLGVPGAPEEWVGRELSELLVELNEREPRIVAEALAEERRVLGGDDAPAEGEFETSGFVLHWLSLPVGSGGSSRSRLVVIRDVTAERHAEALRHDLARSLVHDLRNPLSTLGASMALLLEELPEERRELPRLALKSARRMEVMVESILDIARLESGRMPLRRYPVPAASLVAEAAEGARVIAQRRGIALESSVAPDLPPVHVDAELAGRVLQNLVGNAIKFIGEGGRVMVEARPAPRDPAFVELSVADDGPGIPSEVKDRLFEKFAHGPQRQRGSGLGLAFCRLAVEAHGGRIWVEPGPGARFCFTLPVSREALPEAVVEEAKPARPARALRVLVADDDPVSRRVAQIALARLGHEVHEAGDGEEALAEIRRAAYDVVLLDLDMPRLDGVETARRIVAEHPGVRPRLVALTGYTRREDRERCAAAGMLEFLNKPVRLEAIEALLGRAPSAPGAAAAPEPGAPAPAGFPRAEIGVDARRWAELETLEEGAPGLVAELAQSFVAQAPQRLAELRAAVAADDGPRARRMAHALRGSCASLGVICPSPSCARIEAGAPAAAAAPLVDEIAADLERIAAFLAAKTATRPRTPAA